MFVNGSTRARVAVARTAQKTLNITPNDDRNVDDSFALRLLLLFEARSVVWHWHVKNREEIQRLKKNEMRKKLKRAFSLIAHIILCVCMLCLD